MIRYWLPGPPALGLWGGLLFVLDDCAQMRQSFFSPERPFGVRLWSRTNFSLSIGRGGLRVGSGSGSFFCVPSDFCAIGNSFAVCDKLKFSGQRRVSL